MDKDSTVVVADLEKAPASPSLDNLAMAESKAIEASPENKRLFRRISIRLIFVLGIVYGISVIDRINIGQARVVGMNQDLDLLKGARYSIALLVYFPTTLVFELAGNMALVKFGVANTLSVLVFCIGIFTIAQGHVQNWQTLAAMRAFLGAFEASIFPATIYILASWYPRYKVHKVLSGMYALGLLSSAFAGVLAWGIGKGMYGLRGMKGWRWVFTIEGIATMVIGIVARFFIDDFPDRAKFLSDAERVVVLRRLELDRGKVTTEQLSKANLKDLKDWMLWLSTMLYLCNVAAVYGLSFFVPSILLGLGYSGFDAALYSAWPYLVAIGFLFISATIGDKYKRRLPLVVTQALIAIVGFVLMGQTTLSSKVRYSGVFLAIAGCHSNNSAILIFSQNNVVGSSKSNLASILNIAGGCIGGIIGSTIFRSQDAPEYHPGFRATIALQALILVMAVVAWTVLGSRNREADRRGLVLNGTKGWRYTL